MKKNSSISVIIPIYNVENYLPKCIESVIPYNFFEVILVDDGSTDKSGKICDKYARCHKNITAIHQSNKGLSGARNTGILAARGEYLMFIDGDDYLANGINFNKLLNGNSDIIQYGWISEYQTKKPIRIHNRPIDNLEDISYRKKIAYLFKKNQIAISAWSKIVKRDLIIDRKIFFTEKLISEDVDWSLSLFLHAKSLKIDNQEVYIYRKNRNGSITNTKQQKSISSLLYILKKWTNYNYPDDEYKTIYFTYLSYWYVILLTKIKRKEDMLQAKRYEFLFNYSDSKKMSMVKAALKVFGPKATIAILRTYIYLHSKGIINL